MQDLNHITVIGRVTKTVGSDEYSYQVTSNGTAKAVVTIAVNRSVKKNNEWSEKTAFFDVTIWGKMAENLKSHLVKGKQIGIEGYLEQDRWEKDGQKMNKIYIVAEKVELLGGGNTKASEAPVAVDEKEECPFVDENINF